MIAVMDQMRNWNYVIMPLVHQINLCVATDGVFQFIGFAMVITIVMMQLMKIEKDASLLNVALINFGKQIYLNLIKLNNLVVQTNINAFHLQIIVITKMIVAMDLMKIVAQLMKINALIISFVVLLPVFAFRKHGNAMDKW